MSITFKIRGASWALALLVIMNTRVHAMNGTLPGGFEEGNKVTLVSEGGLADNHKGFFIVRKSDEIEFGLNDKQEIIVKAVSTRTTHERYFFIRKPIPEDTDSDSENTEDKKIKPGYRVLEIQQKGSQFVSASEFENCLDILNFKTASKDPLKVKFGGPIEIYQRAVGYVTRGQLEEHNKTGSNKITVTFYTYDMATLETIESEWDVKPTAIQLYDPAKEKERQDRLAIEKLNAGINSETSPDDKLAGEVNKSTAASNGVESLDPQSSSKITERKTKFARNRLEGVKFDISAQNKIIKTAQDTIRSAKDTLRGLEEKKKMWEARIKKYSDDGKAIEQTSEHKRILSTGVDIDGLVNGHNAEPEGPKFLEAEFAGRTSGDFLEKRPIIDVNKAKRRGKERLLVEQANARHCGMTAAAALGANKKPEPKEDKRGGDRGRE